MFNYSHYKTAFGILCCSLIALIPALTSAQERDTAEVELKDRELNLNRQMERPMSGGMMTDMGTYEVPSKAPPYQRPFMGQKHLDRAVEAYREQQGTINTDSWFWQFLRAVSPYVQLGAFKEMELQYVDRNNPLWESYEQDFIPDLNSDEN